VKHPRTALAVILLVVSLASCKSGGSSFKTKKQRAREAVEALEMTCRNARLERHAEQDTLLLQKRSAVFAVDSLDYEDQPVYRRRLNDAWEDCAYYDGYQIVRKALEPNGHPLTEEEIHHLSHHDAIEVIAADEFLKETKDRKELDNMYPYPNE
jgi:hypothetical protein